MFGDFVGRAQFTRNLRMPGEDYLCKESLWTAEEVMEDFQEFVATAINITDLLTESLPGSDSY